MNHDKRSVAVPDRVLIPSFLLYFVWPKGAHAHVFPSLRGGAALAAGAALALALALALLLLLTSTRRGGGPACAVALAESESASLPPPQRQMPRVQANPDLDTVDHAAAATGGAGAAARRAAGRSEGVARPGGRRAGSGGGAARGTRRGAGGPRGAGAAAAGGGRSVRVHTRVRPRSPHGAPAVEQAPTPAWGWHMAAQPRAHAEKMLDAADEVVRLTRPGEGPEAQGLPELARVRGRPTRRALVLPLVDRTRGVREHRLEMRDNNTATTFQRDPHRDTLWVAHRGALRAWLVSPTFDQYMVPTPTDDTDNRCVHASRFTSFEKLPMVHHAQVRLNTTTRPALLVPAGGGARCRRARRAPPCPCSLGII